MDTGVVQSTILRDKDTVSRPNVLTAVEHQQLIISDSGDGAVTRSEADILSGLNETRPGFCQRYHNYVKLSQYAGVIRLGARVLEVLPKTSPSHSLEQCRGTLLRLIRLARSTPSFIDAEVAQQLNRGSLLEVFIEVFFREVLSLARGGLLQQYAGRADDLNVVRGRINLQRQLTALASRRDVLACNYDELTYDNSWNRLLKSAVRAVRPWIVSPHIYRQWNELIATFDGVSDVRPSQRSLIPTRQTTRYKRAAQWANWILNLLTPAIRAGKGEAPGMLFEMNKLFERAVANWLRSRTRPSVSVREQDVSTHFAVTDGGRAAINLRPDLVFREGQRVILIADTKWKMLVPDNAGQLLPSEADTYQMHAYSSRLLCDDVCLIYPWHDGLADSRETSLRVTAGQRETRIHVACIDFSSELVGLRRGGAVVSSGCTGS